MYCGHVVASTARTSRLGVHLRRLPTEAPWVLVGPGENAGVVDVGDGIAAAIRIESHNHPSAIEPYQGAATGVGGILRDIFTMGARPIALMDPLRFGPLDDARSRWIAEGVVSRHLRLRQRRGRPDRRRRGRVRRHLRGQPPGQRALPRRAARSIGWSSARPRAWATWPCCSGPAPAGTGSAACRVLASAGFGDAEADAAKRPSVQVGDPFEEKRLIEACLALLDAGLVVGIQDLGGAGLCCATSETASRAGMGMDVDVSAVPRRQPGMEPFEIMTSESQERMLAIVKPEDLDEVLAICERWEVRAARGRTGHRTGARCASSTARRRGAGRRSRVVAPRCRARSTTGRCGRATAPRSAIPACSRPPGDACGRRARDAVRPGLDLAPVRPPAVPQHRRRARWGRHRAAAEAPDHAARTPAGRSPSPPTATTAGARSIPRAGTARVVAEAVLNLACVGARPLALVNCLNFGNPEHPEVMWELSEAIDGMAEACRAFGLPVVGGNVSLYNETRGRDIDPTPVVGVLGLVDSVVRRPPGPSPGRGRAGARARRRRRRRPWPGPDGPGSRGRRAAPSTCRTWPAVAALAGVVRGLVADDLLLGVHDVADGGLALAVAEMAAMSAVGVVADQPLDHLQLFGESPDRVVVCVDPGRVE